MTIPTVDLAILIDDNEIDLFVQKRFLEISQFAIQVVTYNSPFLALKALMDENVMSVPKIIFLDLNMPEMDGFGFLEQYTRFPQTMKDTTKVVVVTSSSSLIDKERALSFEPVIHFMSKPLSDKDLNTIHEIMLG